MTEPVSLVARDGDVSEEMILELAELISGGGIVILPTDTIYGLHCQAMNQDAVGAVYSLKEREKRKPLIVLSSGMSQLTGLGVVLTPELEALLSSIWPAPLTAILPLREPIPASAGTLALAVRIPSIPWLRRLISRVGPLASTSLNLSGNPAIHDLKGVDEQILSSVAGLLDTGPLDGQASTVVDFTSGEPRTVRKGTFRFTQELWKKPRKSL